MNVFEFRTPVALADHVEWITTRFRTEGDLSACLVEFSGVEYYAGEVEHPANLCWTPALLPVRSDSIIFVLDSPDNIVHLFPPSEKEPDTDD